MQEAVSRRPPISLYGIVARTHMCTYAANVWDVSIVQGPFSVAPCRTLRLRFAFSASLCGPWLVRRVPGRGAPLAPTPSQSNPGAVQSLEKMQAVVPKLKAAAKAGVEVDGLLGMLEAAMGRIESKQRVADWHKDKKAEEKRKARDAKKVRDVSHACELSWGLSSQLNRSVHAK